MGWLANLAKAILDSDPKTSSACWKQERDHALEQWVRAEQKIAAMTEREDVQLKHMQRCQHGRCHLLTKELGDTKSDG